MRRASTLRRLAVVTIAALLAQGCSSEGGLIRDELKQTRDGRSQELKRYLDQQAATSEAPQVKQGGEIAALPWVSTQRIPRAEERPDFLERPAVINQAYPAPIGQVLSQMKAVITKAAGRPVDVQLEPDAFESGQALNQALARAAPAGAAPGLPQPIAAPGAAGGNPDLAALQSIMLAGALDNGSAHHDKTVALSYKGTVQGMLDAAAINLGLHWRFDGVTQRITFYRYVTREWQIAMTPGSATASASLNADGGSESSAGSGASQTSFSGELSIWKALESAVKVAMSPGGRMSVTEATSMLVVRDTEEAVERIDELVKKVNDAFRYQVTVDVRIYRVQANEQDLRGLNWKGLFDSVGIKVDSDTGLAQSSASGLSALTLSVQESAQGDLRQWRGSELVLESLSRLGEVSAVTNATVKTINNQPAPVRVGRRISYLKSVSTNAVSSVGTSTTLTPGFVDTGLTLAILPTVQEGGRDLLMQVMLTLAELNGITEFSSGGSKVQFPDVSSRDFLQRSWLRSGDTLLLFGFESMNEFVKNDGLLHHALWGLGGRSSANAEKESLVVMMTPVVSSIRQGVR